MGCLFTGCIQLQHRYGRRQAGGRLNLDPIELWILTYTINLDHYRSLLGTNSPGFDGARLLRTKREGSCTNKILGGSSHLNKLVIT